MLLHIYQIFSSLQDRLHFFVHFFFNFIANFFLNHPIFARGKVKVLYCNLKKPQGLNWEEYGIRNDKSQIASRFNEKKKELEVTRCLFWKVNCSINLVWSINLSAAFVFHSFKFSFVDEVVE